ncbi:MAG: permease [Candidatus Nanopelagicales bacterium]|jgi:uncharacterized protein|nr:permease [Candidatus Nanopelagicales bacterium]
MSQDVDATPKEKRWRIGSLELLIIGLIALVLGQQWIVTFFTNPALQTASTIFVSIVVQAMPFLVGGVLLSGAVTAFIPASVWQRVLPKNKALAVPVSGCAGMLLPGCECASVPVAGSLVSKGVPASSALTFLLAAPAINPIVLVSTFVAFPGEPALVLARFVASLATAIIVGWIWLRFGQDSWMRMASRLHLVGDTKFETFRRTAAHDFLHAGGFLVFGAAIAAFINVIIPAEWMQSVADNPVLAIGFMALLAIVLSICSEADAFVASSFTQFSLTSKLVFMVVGPMVDIKLVAMQTGIFGRRFAMRFAPTTLVVAIAMSLIVGGVLLT